MKAPVKAGDLIRFAGGWIRVLDGRAKLQISVPGNVEIDRSDRVSIAKQPKKGKNTGRTIQ